VCLCFFLSLLFFVLLVCHIGCDITQFSVESFFFSPIFSFFPVVALPQKSDQVVEGACY